MLFWEDHGFCVLPWISEVCGETHTFIYNFFTNQCRMRRVADCPLKKTSTLVVTCATWESCSGGNRWWENCRLLSWIWCHSCYDISVLWEWYIHQSQLCCGDSCFAWNSACLTTTLPIHLVRDKVSGIRVKIIVMCTMMCFRLWLVVWVWDSFQRFHLQGQCAAVRHWGS
jgi:hypothetical protein